ALGERRAEIERVRGAAGLERLGERAQARLRRAPVLERRLHRRGDVLRGDRAPERTVHHDERSVAPRALEGGELQEPDPLPGPLPGEREAFGNPAHTLSYSRSASGNCIA